mmetsp:Transcript_15443/g.29472  ORF Transcript_15443/g.29472 Transcript_15443/m.29472 type:complete len:87 (-) Transcript_15443:841-1101(-)
MATSRYTRNGTIEAPTHNADPVQHKIRCTLAPVFKDSLWFCCDARSFNRLAMPSAQAASAHATVKPYAGAEGARASPKAVAVSADA